MSQVVIDFRLEEGHGRFEPVSFGGGEGNIDLLLDLDAGTEPPGGSMQVEMRRVDLNDVLRPWNLADESVGMVGGRGKFWIEGRSVAQLLASADGGLLLCRPASEGWCHRTGYLRHRYPGHHLHGRWRGEPEYGTPGISIFAHPKDPSVFTGRAPFHLGGTFDDIEAGVHGGGLGMRAGASAVLGALGGPIAALLPLLEVGAGPDMAYCEGLVSRSREAIRDEEGGP